VRRKTADLLQQLAKIPALCPRAVVRLQLGPGQHVLPIYIALYAVLVWLGWPRRAGPDQRASICVVRCARPTHRVRHLLVFWPMIQGKTGLSPGIGQAGSGPSNLR